MGARDVKIGAVIDAIAWLKAALLVAIGTPPGSPERRAKLEELTRAVEGARRFADVYQGKLAAELRIALKVAELGLRYLQSPGRNPGRHVQDA